MGLPSSFPRAEGVHQLGEWVLQPEVLLLWVTAAMAPPPRGTSAQNAAF